jgi:sterol desaturase/sphingolipid hydroxylase (fatty acid hydroxylase superfamily)
MHLPPLFFETGAIAATQLVVYAGFAIHGMLLREEGIWASVQLAAMHVAVAAVGGIGLTLLIGPTDLPPRQRTLSRMDGIPPPTEIFVDVATAVLLFDFVFYILHRLMHTSFLCRKVHSRHHLAHIPSPFAVVHAHPLDYLLTQALPVMGLVRLLNAHAVTMGIVGSSGLLAAMYSHSKDLAGVMSHQKHHRQPKMHFGALGLADTIAQSMEHAVKRIAKGFFIWR